MKVILILSVVVLVASCKQEEIEPTPTAPVTDIDGNEYATIQIGTQVWMAENLRTSKYCNGDPIPNAADNTQWSNLTTGAWAHYDNDSQYEELYGKLYNWYAAADTRNICPCGWHVPTDAEWTVLSDYLGGEDVAGTKMKTTIGWNENGNGTNESGFSGLPGGVRGFSGTFYDVGDFGYWWSSLENTTGDAWYRVLGYFADDLARDKIFMSNGFSVRCLRD